MLLTEKNIWVAFLLFAKLCIRKSFSDCEIPANLNTVLSFNKVSEDSSGKRYLIRCLDTDEKLFPLGEWSDVLCSNDSWRTTSGQSETVLDIQTLECLKLCREPSIANGNYILSDEYLNSSHRVPISIKYDGYPHYIPGVVLELECDTGYSLSYSHLTTTICGGDGQWTPPLPTCTDGDITTKTVEESVSIDPNSTMVIAISVSVGIFIVCAVLMATIAIRAKWRVVCRKRRAPTSHPDDINYPHGYTQLGSGSFLPSYAEAIDYEDDEFRTHSHGMDSVYRPTTTTADYRQLSSLESSSRDESLSMSAASQSHRHSLFSGTSANYRATGGDDISDILVHGDHLSMSDTSTLVTVNTYESNPTASNPSLTNSRRGVAGSMNSNVATSMDDVPLIVRGGDDCVAGDVTNNNLDC